MDYRVLITDEALSDLNQIVEFIAQDDHQAARRVGQKLLDRALSLRTFPERHAFYDANREIRKMAAPPYQIYYTCDHVKGVVFVLHFWHSARQGPRFTGD